MKIRVARFGALRAFLFMVVYTIGHKFVHILQYIGVIV